MTTQERFIARETQMQRLRWATPAGLFILTVVLAVSGWLFVDYLTQIRSAIADLKSDSSSHYTALWRKMDDVSTKEEVDVKCINNNFRKCESCRSADVC